MYYQLLVVYSCRKRYIVRHLVYIYFCIAFRFHAASFSALLNRMVIKTYYPPVARAAFERPECFFWLNYLFIIPELRCSLFVQR